MSEAITLGDCEYYPTPAWVVLRLLERTTDVWRTGVSVYEPCAGEGAIVEAVLAGLPDTLLSIAFGDIRQTEYLTRHGVKAADYLARRDLPRCRINIQNPPFSLGLKFAAKAIVHCEHVFMLHRRNWLVSALKQDRAWLEQHTPNAEFVVPDRISFYDGTSDSQEYEWYYWGQAFSGLHFLAPTPLDQRRQTLRAIEAQGVLAL